MRAAEGGVLLTRNPLDAPQGGPAAGYLARLAGHDGIVGGPAAGEAAISDRLSRLAEEELVAAVNHRLGKARTLTEIADVLHSFVDAVDGRLDDVRR